MSSARSTGGCASASLFRLRLPLTSAQLIKYGVISVKHLCDDLRDWETLYMSGRMQKPVRSALSVASSR